MSVQDNDGFVSRWSRRKALARQGALPAEPAPPDTQPPKSNAAIPGAPTQATERAVGSALQPARPTAEPPASVAEPDPPPTLADVEQLTRDSDFRRFVGRDVEPAVKNAALKKLFGDPRFNVMDGLDVYIDDYSRPDPLPLASVRKMAQAAFLGLLDTENAAPAQPLAPSTAAPTEPIAEATLKPPEAVEPAAMPQRALPCAPEADENADLRLQPHDAARCAGLEPRAAADGTSKP
jgi:hypothetical protein